MNFGLGLLLILDHEEENILVVSQPTEFLFFSLSYFGYFNKKIFPIRLIQKALDETTKI